MTPEAIHLLQFATVCVVAVVLKVIIRQLYRGTREERRLSRYIEGAAKGDSAPVSDQSRDSIGG